MLLRTSKHEWFIAIALPCFDPSWRNAERFAGTSGRRPWAPSGNWTSGTPVNASAKPLPLGELWMRPVCVEMDSQMLSWSCRFASPSGPTTFAMCGVVMSVGFCGPSDVQVALAVEADLIVARHQQADHALRDLPKRQHPQLVRDIVHAVHAPFRLEHDHDVVLGMDLAKSRGEGCGVVNQRIVCRQRVVR